MSNSKEEEQQQKQAKRAAMLRENLKKRKAQAKAHTKTQGGKENQNDPSEPKS